MADRPPAGDDKGRRVLGRSADAEPRRVVVDPDAQPSDGPSSPPPPAPTPGSPSPAAAPPPPPAVPPSSGRPVRVLGRSSSAASGPTVAAAPSDPPPPPPGRGTATSSGGPPPRGPRARGPRTARRRFPLRRLVLAALALVVLIPVVLFALGWWQFSRIPRVEVASALSSGAGRSGTNYLIVGTDSREGIGSDDPNAGAFLDEGVTGSRTDTIMVLRVENGGSRLLSVPRDLWVTDPATGEKGRINSTFAAGPANLITAVRELGIPVDHYLEINFVSFTKLVDAVGGITVDFDAPARDTHSGLQVDEAGPQRLDGSQALAYVRSRYYERLVDGTWQTDPTADIGRTERQRTFLTALMGEVSGERNPLSLARIPGALGGGMKIDDELSFLDALGLVWDMRSGSPGTEALPVTPRTTSGGAAVLELQPSAGDVIATFAR